MTERLGFIGVFLPSWDSACELVSWKSLPPYHGCNYHVRPLNDTPLLLFLLRKEQMSIFVREIASSRIYES